VITFLIVVASLYILLASSVAQFARSHGRNPLHWFLCALAINPVIAQFLLLSRTEGSRLANPDAADAPDQSSLFGAAHRSVL
jgi:hypothetical protein